MQIYMWSYQRDTIWAGIALFTRSYTHTYTTKSKYSVLDAIKFKLDGGWNTIKQNVGIGVLVFLQDELQSNQSARVNFLH